MLKNYIQKIISFRSFYFLFLVFASFYLIFNSLIIIKDNLDDSKVQISYNNISKNNLLDEIHKNRFLIKNYLKAKLNLDHIKINKDKNIETNKKGIFLSKLPEDLHLITDTKKKKEKFINSLLPLIIEQNNAILKDRNKLLAIKKSINLNNTLNKEQRDFLNDLSNFYSVKTKNIHKVDIIESLLLKVDIIPISIVLAQAANESGWGSSRFARDYNALFGQYTYDINKGIKPSFREDGKKHLIKFFQSINKSVESYFNNINTNIAYKDFRNYRKVFRENSNSKNFDLLLEKLDIYAADKNYVKIIRSIIKINNLQSFDNLKSISTTS